MRLVTSSAAAMFFAVLAVSAIAEEESERLAKRAWKHTAGVESDGRLLGAAVLIKYDGKMLYLTCAHVVKVTKPESLKLVQERRDGTTVSVSAKIVRQAADGEPDLALLEADKGLELVAAELAAERPATGQQVSHVGACFGKLSFTKGYVARPKFMEQGQEFISLGSMLASGSSGGGVWQKDGKLIGLAHSTVPGQLSWCIPASVVRSWLAKKPEEKKPEEKKPQPKAEKKG